MVKPLIMNYLGRPVFSWNTNANVGLRCPNRDDDVQLVQLGYYCKLRNNAFSQNLTQDEKATYARVNPGDRCTGQDDDPLVQAIKAHQKSRGGIQDSHVSVIPDNLGIYTATDGQHVFMLLALMNNVSDMLGGKWPRIQDHPNCPPTLRVVAEAACALKKL